MSGKDSYEKNEVREEDRVTRAGVGWGEEVFDMVV